MGKETENPHIVVRGLLSVLSIFLNKLNSIGRVLVAFPYCCKALATPLAAILFIFSHFYAIFNNSVTDRT